MITQKTQGRDSILLLSILVAMLLFHGCQDKEDRQQVNDRPNIVLIMADDMGFSDIGSYGGEIQTPHIDELAQEGLRYTHFYNNARCCPTRASLMTGLYPHQAGMGWMTAADLGTPQYQGELNKQCVTIAEVLKKAGYSTYMTGKWHLSRVRNIKAGMKENWPKQRGFDRFFGIVDGAANYFNPMVYSDNKKYQAPEDDFYFTHAVSDTSVKFLDQHFRQANVNPLFMYVAYTAPHWPLHALEEDIEQYKNVYSAGWDELRKQRLTKQKEIGIFDPSVALSPRDEVVPAWNELPENEKEEFVMRMAIYAAQIDAMDQGIGRIVDKLEELGQLDNTLIFFLSDNGACAEYISGGESKAVNGKANTWESYRIHWANLSSTPYKEYKHWIHEGGIATPLIAHWPNGIDSDLANGFVREPGHIVDVMATIVDVSGADYPEQYKGQPIQPMEGQSLIPHFKGKKNNRKPIYWEHEANIGVRSGKWKLVAKTEENADFDPNTLELYDMEQDPSELHNLADTYPDQLNELFEHWKEWANRIHVFPMDSRAYGQRARDYQRQINGEFDGLFGGWEFSGENSVRFSIDTTGQVSGANSAKMEAFTNPMDSAVLQWPLFVKKGESFHVRFKIKGTEGTWVKVVFEAVNGETRALMEQSVELTQDIQEINVKTRPPFSEGRYRLAFYMNAMAPGTRLWIDDVELNPY